jgi:hypothetical protein
MADSMKRNQLPGISQMTRKQYASVFLRRILGTLVVFLGISIAGCTRTAGDSSGMPQFVPPTLVPTSAPTTTPLAVIQADTSDEGSGISGEPVDCVDALTFITDNTIPDDTVVVPGSSMDKRWEVENNGTCNWGEGYELRMISGERMSAETVQALPPARSGARATIRVEFTAPTTPGTYRADWQAFNPSGEPFGDAFYLQIVVQE